MKFKLKDPGSAITHGNCPSSRCIRSSFLLLSRQRVLYECAPYCLLLSIFILTMVLLYAASTILPFCRFYRGRSIDGCRKKMDHMNDFW